MSWTALPQYPDCWYSTVRVERRTQPDRRGRYDADAKMFEVPRCLLAPGNTSADPRPSGVVDSAPRLYRHAGEEPDFTFQPGDVIICPNNSFLPGRWHIDGQPKQWPFGWEVPLKREDGGE